LSTKSKVLIIILAAIVLWLILKGGFGPKPSYMVEPKEYIVASQDISKAVYGSGYLRCAVRAEVESELDGKIIDIRVKEGDLVDTGTILAVMDNENIENEISIARGEVDNFKEELEKMRLKPDLTDKWNAEISFQDAKENYEKLKRDLDEKKRLYEQELGGTPREIEELENAVVQAEKKMKIAEKNLKETSKPATAVQIAAAESQLNQSRVKLKNLENKFKSQQVYSPIKGTVLKRFIDPEAVRLDSDKTYPERTELFTIGDLATLMIEGSIFESDVQKLRPDQRVKIVLNPAADDWTWGRLERVSLTPSGAADGGKFDVDIVFENVPPNINEGLRVDFQIIVREAKAVPAVPVEFVTRDKTGHFVLLEKNGKLLKHKVGVGISDDDFYEIKSGLQLGDKVVWRVGGA